MLGINKSSFNLFCVDVSFLVLDKQPMDINQASQQLKASPPVDVTDALVFLRDTVKKDGDKDDIKLVADLCSKDLMKKIEEYKTLPESQVNPDTYCNILKILYFIAQHDFGREILINNGILENTSCFHGNSPITTGIGSLILIRLGAKPAREHTYRIARGIGWFFNNYSDRGFLDDGDEKVIEMVSLVIDFLDEARKTTICNCGTTVCHYHGLVCATFIYCELWPYASKQNPVFLRFMCHFAYLYNNNPRKAKYLHTRLDAQFRLYSSDDRSGDIFAMALHDLGDQRLSVKLMNERYHS